MEIPSNIITSHVYLYIFPAGSLFLQE